MLPLNALNSAFIRVPQRASFSLTTKDLKFSSQHLYEWIICLVHRGFVRHPDPSGDLSHLVSKSLLPDFPTVLQSPMETNTPSGTSLWYEWITKSSSTSQRCQSPTDCGSANDTWKGNKHILNLTVPPRGVSSYKTTGIPAECHVLQCFPKTTEEEN